MKRKAPAYANHRPFRTTQRLLEDDELDKLVMQVACSVPLPPGRALQILPTCHMDEWGMVQLGYGEGTELAVALEAGPSITPPKESLPSTFFAGLVNVLVGGKHPHWIIFLADPQSAQIWLVDSLSRESYEVNESDSFSSDESGDENTTTTAQESLIEEPLSTSPSLIDDFLARSAVAVPTHADDIRAHIQHLLPRCDRWNVEVIYLGVQHDSINCGIWALEVFQYVIGTLQCDLTQLLHPEVFATTSIKQKRAAYSDCLYPPKSKKSKLAKATLHECATSSPPIPPLHSQSHQGTSPSTETWLGHDSQQTGSIEEYPALPPLLPADWTPLVGVSPAQLRADPDPSYSTSPLG